MKSKIQTPSSKKRLIYLDYAASTPVIGIALKEMNHYFMDHFGNPGSIHCFGQKAQLAIDKAREIISNSIGAEFNEIIFTSSATEANNLALRGAIKAAREMSKQPCRIIVSSIEHESILNTAKDLEREGVEVVYLPVDKEGFIKINTLKENLTDNTILVSIIYASNVIGAVEPIKEISSIIKKFRGNKAYPLFHVDAVQAFQFLNCAVDNLGVDLMTISSQKIYGPKGAGALYIRNNITSNSQFPILNSIITGGSQEYGFRSGTENVPAIAGFGRAAELIQKNKAREVKRIKNLRDYFWHKLKNAKPEIELNGPPVSSPDRLVNNLNIYFPGHDSQDLLIKFDLNGIAVSMGSACLARSAKSSYVITALNLGEHRAKSSLRFSLGVPTTKKELDIALRRIINLI